MQLRTKRRSVPFARTLVCARRVRRTSRSMRLSGYRHPAPPPRVPARPSPHHGPPPSSRSRLQVSQSQAPPTQQRVCRAPWSTIATPRWSLAPAASVIAPRASPPPLSAVVHLSPRPSLVARRASTSASPPSSSPDIVASLNKLKKDFGYHLITPLWKRGDFSCLLANVRLLGIVGPAETLTDFFAWCERAAQSGTPAGLYALGVCYAGGIGTQRNVERAEQLMAQAAALGDDDATQQLAMSYIQTKGRPEDVKRGIELLSEAAARGNADAQFHLAWHIYRGKGADKDVPRAMALFSQAATQDHSNALWVLYNIHLQEDRSDQDYVQMLNRSASRGNVEAMHTLAKVNLALLEQEKAAITERTQEYCVNVQTCLTHATRLGDVKSKVMLKEWYARAARLGGQHRANAAALALKLLREDVQRGHVDVLTVGSCHRLGVLSKAEFAQALGILAGLTTVNAAMAYVGQALLMGERIGIVKDEANGLRMLRIAAQRGCAEATGILGVAYRDGLGVPVNLERAIALLWTAFEQNSASAAWELGQCYMMGQGVEKSTVAGLRMLIRAAEIELLKGDTVYPHLLGCVYSEGVLVPKDEAKAEEWLRKAAAHGDELAAADLKRFAAMRALSQ